MKKFKVTIEFAVDDDITIEDFKYPDFKHWLRLSNWWEMLSIEEAKQ